MTKIDLKKYPNIVWACRNREKTTIFLENFRFLLPEMDNLELIIKAIRELGCEGIQEKIDDLDKSKVYSTIAELKIARRLLELGHRVTLLKDDYLQGKSPDMLVKTSQGDIYVEVYHISSSDPVSFLIKTLRDITSKFTYIVNFSFKPEVSSPHLKYDVRKLQHSKLNVSADKFEKELEKIESESFPINGKTDAFSYEIVGTVTEGHGYPAILISTYSINPDHAYSHLSYYLNLKGEKFVSFPADMKRAPYILAFVCADPGINCYEVKSLLYGDVIENAMIQDTSVYRAIRESRWKKTVKEREEHSSWLEIEKAIKIGWEEVLLKTYLIPRDYCYVEKQGIFLTSPVMKNVSGVIFYSASERIEFYPNPFAIFDINRHQLEKQLGISFFEKP